MVSGSLGNIIADYSILLHYLFINLPTDRNNPFICVNKAISKKMFVCHAAKYSYRNYVQKAQILLVIRFSSGN
jgi:hypothetical protein